MQLQFSRQSIGNKRKTARRLVIGLFVPLHRDPRPGAGWQRLWFIDEKWNSHLGDWIFVRKKKLKRMISTPQSSTQSKNESNISQKEKWILGIFSITRISKKLLATNEFQKNAQRKLFTQNSTDAYGKCSQNYEIMFMTAHKARTEFSDCLMHWVTFYKLLFF